MKFKTWKVGPHIPGERIIGVNAWKSKRDSAWYFQWWLFSRMFCLSWGCR